MTGDIFKDSNTMLEKVYNAINHRVVRDLAWALLSPPLLEQLEEDSQSLLQQEYLDSKDDIFEWLLRVDQSPEALIHYVQQRSQVRIGIYFEQLLGFYFSHYPRFELLNQNLQVQGAKRTLGEFDFIIRDKKNGMYFHIESAVKFYLGGFESDLLTNNIELYNWHQWIGPNKKDSLSLKINSMLSKQLQLSQTPEGHKLLTDQNIPADQLQTRLLLRGRFFAANNQASPLFSHPQTCQHHWHRINAFINQPATKHHYLIVPKTYWLCPLAREDFVLLNQSYNKNELIDAIQIEVAQGISTWLIAGFDENSGANEIERFFIVN